MSTMIDTAVSPNAVSPGVSSEDDIRTHVWHVLGALYPKGGRIERRVDQRYPYPYVVELAPLASDGTTPEGKPLSVIGKHLSDGGLSFYHPTPLPYRRMQVTLDASSDTPKRFIIDLAWCRFTGQGWYESGGRFLKVVE